nr:M24 family metallopeptidase [[Eubacterium] tenue]
MDLHEEPFLVNYGTKVIEKGCIITMEPGLYIPGFGGVRI